MSIDKLPVVQTVISIKKNPNCKDPMCDDRGIRKDVKMGKLMGGGCVYCNCCIYETIEKNQMNKSRELLGMDPLP